MPSGEHSHGEYSKLTHIHDLLPHAHGEYVTRAEYDDLLLRVAQIEVEAHTHNDTPDPEPEPPGPAEIIVDTAQHSVRYYLDRAQEEGGTYRFPPGVYVAPNKHFWLWDNAAPIRLLGHGATLMSTDPFNAVLETGNLNDVAIEGFTLRYQSTPPARTHRGHGYFNDAPSRNVRLRDLRVENVTDAGFLLHQLAFFSVERCSVHGSGADAFHVTNTSQDGRIAFCDAEAPGDDCFAVVSYSLDGAPCWNIEFESCHGWDGHARGLAVVGGEGVTYRNCLIERSAKAGIYLMPEAGAGIANPSLSDRDITIEDARLVGCAHAQPRDHPSILVGVYQSTSLVVDGVTLRDIAIEQPVTEPIRVGARVTGLVRERISVDGALI